jgi:hypothetical protein
MTARLSRNGQSSCTAVLQARLRQRAAAERIYSLESLLTARQQNLIVVALASGGDGEASEQHASQGCFVRRTMKEYTSYT